MCTCVKRLNVELAKHNTVLSEVSMLNMATGKCRQSLQIVTQKIVNLRDGKKAKIVLPTFCPFCGKRSAPKPRASKVTSTTSGSAAK